MTDNVTSRRPGAKLIDLIARAADAAAVANRVKIYPKVVGGFAQLFARSGDGVVHQLTPPGFNGVLPWSNTRTYQAGNTVTRGPYMWAANGTTTEDPIEFGAMDSAAAWVMNTSGASGALQANGEMRLINSVNGMNTAAFRQQAHNGFLGKMLVMDLCMFGTPGVMADALLFGVYDAAAPQVASSLFGLATFYGAEIDIFNSRVTNFVNGAQDSNFGYLNTSSINAGQQYQRWMMQMTANGGNWDLTFYRATRMSATLFGNQNQGAIDDFQIIGQITNRARPAYADWRPVIGARTGGFNALFKCKFFGVRDMTSGMWSPVSQLPTQLG